MENLNQSNKTLYIVAAKAAPANHQKGNVFDVLSLTGWLISDPNSTVFGIFSGSEHLNCLTYRDIIVFLENKDNKCYALMVEQTEDSYSVHESQVYVSLGDNPTYITTSPYNSSRNVLPDLPVVDGESWRQTEVYDRILNHIRDHS